jgi:hypothetical protein
MPRILRGQLQLPEGSMSKRLLRLGGLALALQSVFLTPHARASDAVAWAEARRINSSDAYRAYLKQYPTGEFSCHAMMKLQYSVKGTHCAPERRLRTNTRRTAHAKPY